MGVSNPIAARQMIRAFYTGDGTNNRLISTGFYTIFVFVEAAMATVGGMIMIDGNSVYHPHWWNNLWVKPTSSWIDTANLGFRVYLAVDNMNVNLTSYGYYAVAQ